MYSGYIWKEYAEQDLRSSVSVRLGQVKVREREIGFFLMVMCENQTSEDIEKSGNCCCELVQWFHKRVLLKLQTGKTKKRQIHLCEETAYFIQDYCRKYENLHIGFVLTMDNRIWYSCTGEMELYLVNRRYSKGKISRLEKRAEGIMQRGVGLFLTTSYLLDGVELQDVCDLLVLGKGRNGRNVDNRMKNLEELIDGVKDREKESLHICKEKGAIFVFYE